MNEYFTPPADVAAVTRGRSAKINEIIDAIDTGFDNLPTGLVATTAEVIAARGGEADLDTRLDGFDADIALLGNAELPGQTGNSGKFLTTDGATSSWEAVDLGNGADTSSGATDVTLTSASKQIQYITITAADKFVNLPDATGLNEGADVFVIINAGNYRFGVKDNSGNFICSVDAQAQGRLSLVDNSDAAGTWKATDGSDLIMSRLKTVCNAAASTYIASCKLTSTEVLVAYTGADSDGFCAVLTWDSSTPEITVSNILEFDTTAAAYISCCRMTDTVGIIGYTGSDSDGYICAVTYDGADTLTLTDTHEFKDSDAVNFIQVVPIYESATTGKIGLVYRDGADDIMAQVIDWDGTELTSDTAETTILAGTVTYLSATLMSGAVDSASIAVTYFASSNQSIRQIAWNGTTLSSTVSLIGIGSGGSYIPVVALSSSYILAFTNQTLDNYSTFSATLIYYSGSALTVKRKVEIHGGLVEATVYPQCAILLDSSTVAVTFCYTLYSEYSTKIIKMNAVGALAPEDCVLRIDSEIDYDENNKTYTCLTALDTSNALFMYNSTNDSTYLTAEKIDIG